MNARFGPLWNPKVEEATLPFSKSSSNVPYLMARIVNISYTPHVCGIVDDQVSWVISPLREKLDSLPQLVWSDGTPWREANLWLLERVTDVKIRTVEANASALLGYAQWLEMTGTDWRQFPARKSERCLVRFRGALIEARREGRLASSTVSQRMRQVIVFYRWIRESGQADIHTPMWHESFAHRVFQDPTGFVRTITVQTTDLRIPNRRAFGGSLEGLYPVSPEHRSEILRFVQRKGTEELFLMLGLGFFTGLRIGSICNLKLETLDNAVPDPNSSSLYWLSLGPGATPQVATKLDVTGRVWISKVQLEVLRAYAVSVRRLKREARAAPKNRNLLFLTRFGNPYSSPTSDKSSAVNVEMHTLRKTLPGGEALRGFHFHQSRCTFATELARLAVKYCDPITAIGIVMQQLLQKDEATALKYIHFVEDGEIRQAASDEFTENFLGLLSEFSDPH